MSEKYPKLLQKSINILSAWHREQTVDPRGHVGWRRWGEWRRQHGNMYTVVCKTERQWESAIWLRELGDALWWPGGVGWDGRREGGYGSFMLMPFMLMAETKGKAITLQLKINIFKKKHSLLFQLPVFEHWIDFVYYCWITSKLTDYRWKYVNLAVFY